MDNPKDTRYKLCIVERSNKKYHELAFYTKGDEVQCEDDEYELSFLSEGWYVECEHCERFNKVEDIVSWSELPDPNKREPIDRDVIISGIILIILCVAGITWFSYAVNGFRF